MLVPLSRMAALLAITSILGACQSNYDNKPNQSVSPDPTAEPVSTSVASTDTGATEHGNSWPSIEQTELVKTRLATFPIQSWESSVDWYEPLTTVPGVNQSEFMPMPAVSSLLAPADTLVDSHQSHAFLVWHNGALIHERYRGKFDQDSRYDTASMHKSVVAILIGIAVDEGLIKSVNDPIDNYLPHLRDTSLGAVPLRAFLHMSSGIAVAERNNDPAGPALQMQFGNDIKNAMSKFKNPLKPYEEFAYNATNTQYLAWVIEQASKMRYQEFLAKKLWQPLGNAEARLWLDRKGGTPRASCCLQANARDWLRVGLLLLNSGKAGDTRIVSRDWIKEMTMPSDLNPNYGYQVWLGSPHQPKRTYHKKLENFIPAKEPFVRDDIVYFDGWGGQRVYVVPSENLVIVRIGKTSFTWDDSELPNLVISLIETQ